MMRDLGVIEVGHPMKDELPQMSFSLTAAWLRKIIYTVVTKAKQIYLEYTVSVVGVALGIQLRLVGWYRLFVLSTNLFVQNCWVLDIMSTMLCT